MHVRDVSFIIAGARIGLPTPHMSIFSLGKGEKEHEVFKCEYVGVEARKQDSNMRGGARKRDSNMRAGLESDFSEMKWRKQF